MKKYEIGPGPSGSDHSWLQFEQTKSAMASPSNLEEMDQYPKVDPIFPEVSDCTSFKHVCYPCQGAPWWNPVAIVTELLGSRRDLGE